MSPIPLRAKTLGSAFASVTVSGSSGHPGLSAQYPFRSNNLTQRSQLDGRSHNPCTNTTGVLEDLFARATCRSSSPVTVRSSDAIDFLAMGSTSSEHATQTYTTIDYRVAGTAHKSHKVLTTLWDRDDGDR